MDIMDIRELVSRLTLEEKVSLCSGLDCWHTQDVERLGIPAVMVTDGPCGLRKQEGETDHLGLNDSVEAVCFPTPSAAACSFDREMLFEMGALLGNECQAEDVSVLLGPAVNIKRSPLCGRNFEYYSEDPYAAGELAAAYIRGVQSQNVGTSVKHFAANNQETARMTVSSDVDERALREIYFPAFETAVKKAAPWTVMCSYNKINGTFSSENRWLLTEVLRDEWGFDGYVMSDWGAVHSRVKGIAAGLDLEMPGSNSANDPAVIAAVRSGELSMENLDRSVERILTAVFRYKENRNPEAVFDRDADHVKAVKMAKKCIVLLKNDPVTAPDGSIRPVLPLCAKEKVAFIGGFAKNPRFDGGGSSHVHSHSVISPLALAGLYGNIAYAEGFPAEKDETDEARMEEAVKRAEQAEKIVVFAGLPEVTESESYDRADMRLPECQNVLIERLAELGKPVVVVLSNGSAVEMPWIDRVSGILESYLCGEAVGEAQMEILYGRANPSGKLAETFPRRLQDNPSYVNFPGTSRHVRYGEGIYVGYRYYDKKEMDVLFPFGYGLSYTQFAYSNLRIVKADATGRAGVTVSADITNVGERAGREIVQLYVADQTGSADRPPQELKQFASVELAPGETKTVSMELDERSFSWYDTLHGIWYAADGAYEIRVGRSSREIELTGTVVLSGAKPRVPVIDRDVLIGELLEYEPTSAFIQDLVAKAGFVLEDGGLDEVDAMTRSVVINLPLECLKSYTNVTNDQIDGIIAALQEVVRKADGDESE